MSIPKTYEEFRNRLTDSEPPPLWPEALKALWWDAGGHWENSHQIAQDLQSRTGSWIHAYLHRKEGDRWNANYWYDRAGRPYPKTSSDEEMEEIVTWLLNALEHDPRYFLDQG